MQTLNKRRFFAQTNLNPETIVESHYNFDILFNFCFIYYINPNRANGVQHLFLVYFHVYFLFLALDMDFTEFSFFFLSIFFFFTLIFNLKSWAPNNIRANWPSRACKTTSGNIFSLVFRGYGAFFNGVRQHIISKLYCTDFQ